MRLFDIPLGDPGFLSNILVDKPQLGDRIDLAVIPHYVDQTNPYVQRLSELDGVKVLDVHQEPKTFLSTLAQCRYAISSSLHGLIFSESLGIPNAWVEFSNLVAGEGFKFQDWFSLARRPQANAVSINRAWSRSELVDLCQIHEMDIDRNALSGALTKGIDELELEILPSKRIYAFGECRSRPVPIFIISFNRGDQLLRSIDSYRRLNTAVDIVVHDNGSSDKYTLGILDDLERSGVKLFRSTAITSPDELNSINSTIETYFSDWAEPSRYVVTDGDIDLGGADPDILSIFDVLLDNFRDAACVGPMLKIHDIPSTYALYNHAMNRHIDQFWQKEPLWFTHDEIMIAYQRAPIDTTFALYRAGERFHRLQQGLRVYYPYEASHLDWYEGEAEGVVYRMTSSPTISHWNSQEQIDAKKNEPLRFSQYIRVVPSPDGTLVTQDELL
ncbi:polysaccharide pyruvyl transferase family protein [Mesorhizobium sp. M1396]|uniref:polysaccharide pyruvyl transferase family protein n=1 Tax=Mesorhizobium sp. M1396 TaxID=2957095 RepID=UPI00333BCB39